MLGANGEHLTRPHAIQLFQQLDHGHVLGWAPYRAKKPPDYAAYLKVGPGRRVGRGLQCCCASSQGCLMHLFVSKRKKSQM